MDLNALKFLNSLYNYGQSGFINVSDEEFLNRLSICNSCEFLDRSFNRCNQCGCFLQIKARWATESCPIGKWSAVEHKIKEPSVQPEVTPVKDCGCSGKTNS